MEQAFELLTMTHFAQSVLVVCTAWSKNYTWRGRHFYRDTVHGNKRERRAARVALCTSGPFIRPRPRPRSEPPEPPDIELQATSFLAFAKSWHDLGSGSICRAAEFRALELMSDCYGFHDVKLLPFLLALADPCIAPCCDTGGLDWAENFAFLNHARRLVEASDSGSDMRLDAQVAHLNVSFYCLASTDLTWDHPLPSAAKSDERALTDLIGFHLFRGQFAEAHTAIQDLKALNPGSYVALSCEAVITARTDVRLACVQHEQSISERERVCGKNHDSVGVGCWYYACALSEAGRPREALPFFQRVLAIELLNRAPDHTEVGVIKCHIFQMVRTIAEQ